MIDLKFAIFSKFSSFQSLLVEKYRVRTLFWTKNSRNFQGHISHLSGTPFSTKKSLKSMSFLVLPQHDSRDSPEWWRNYLIRGYLVITPSSKPLIKESARLLNTASKAITCSPVSYTHLRAHETDSYLVCRLLLEKKNNF